MIEPQKTLSAGIVAPEEVILVRVSSGPWDELDSLREIKALVESAGGRVVETFAQKRTAPDPKYYVGSGKLEEVSSAARELGVSTLVFDHNLSPGQVAKLEESTDCKVLDRTEIILAIFATRARTKEAKLQIELAQLRYALPRLTRKWHHLSRLGAGIGTRGPGETQLEIDRRRARSRIRLLESQLDKTKLQGEVRRERRGNLYRVTLVGYTNAGKSTLMNAFCDAGVYSADKPFATLDTVSRKLRLGHDDHILISDTVGFIRRLPETLVASFEATLANVRTAGLLLVVSDRSREDRQTRLATVYRTLERIGAGDIPRLLVWNKMDLARKDLPPRTGIAVSATRREGLDELLKAIRMHRDRRLEWFELSMERPGGKFLNWLYRNCLVRDFDRDGSGVSVLAGCYPGTERIKSRLGGESFGWTLREVASPASGDYHESGSGNG
ncbi:GTPase HflX [Candidatus Fermentibacteria bacterium]|nr:GTPase HflX [Candidatus Fermentibacteria bacterium]